MLSISKAGCLEDALNWGLHWYTFSYFCSLTTIVGIVKTTSVCYVLGKNKKNINFFRPFYTF